MRPGQRVWLRPPRGTPRPGICVKLLGKGRVVAAYEVTPKGTVIGARVFGPDGRETKQCGLRWRVEP